MWLDRIDRHIRALLAANELEDGYIRFSVSAGIGQVGLPAGAYDDPNVIVYVKPLPPYDERTDKYGRGLQLLQTRRNSPESGVRMKSFHYMNNIVAKRELQRYPWAGQAEGLMLNAAGFIAEGIVSNLFFIKDQVLFTPAVETGILPGVTRRYVMQICEQQGILVIEGEFEWEELLDADELFYTNSIQEIVPVTRLFDNEGNMHTVGDGCCGGQTALLLNHYRKAAEEQQ